LWILTFAQRRDDRRDVLAEVAAFADRLRVSNNGERSPYWYSPELHPGGYGWHVNFFIPFRFNHERI
jgi:hypothetical protein